jgi:3-phenylpropionate/trans-cinnamate dioxygenase ferredoxin component
MSAAGTFYKAANISEFTDGVKKKVTVQGQEILLAKVGESFYAVGNKCPHLGGDLSAGKLEGTVIECPRHHSQFDLRNGEVKKWTNWPGPLRTLSEVAKKPQALKVHAVKVENGDILIEI